jgi:Ras-related protein Rab-8A
MKQIQVSTQKDQIAIVLVGNKCDVDNREVSKEEGEALGKEFGLRYYETSALNNLNIEETFSYLSEEIIKLKDKKDVTISAESQNKVINLDSGMDMQKRVGLGKEKKGCC